MSNDYRRVQIYFGRSGELVSVVVNTGLETDKPVIYAYWEASSQEHAELLARHLNDTLADALRNIRRSWYSQGFQDGRKRKTPRWPDYDLSPYRGGWGEP